jgi:hypothetical protein
LRGGAVAGQTARWGKEVDTGDVEVCCDGGVCILDEGTKISGSGPGAFIRSWQRSSR